SISLLRLSFCRRLRLPLPLLSFPTRRSSDLEVGPEAGAPRHLVRAVRSDGARAHVRLRASVGHRLGHGSIPFSSSRRCPSPRSRDRKSTRLNSSHGSILYAVFCLYKNKYCKS